MIDKSNPKYNTIVTVKENGKNYEIDTNKCEVGEEIQCPADKGMTITKIENGCVIIKKLSRLKPF